jgi:hypothetical protein
LLFALVAPPSANAQVLAPDFPQVSTPFSSLAGTPAFRDEPASDRVIKGVLYGAAWGAVAGMLVGILIACPYSEDSGCFGLNVARFAAGGAFSGLLTGL